MKLTISELNQKEINWKDKKTGEDKTGIVLMVKFKEPDKQGQNKVYDVFKGDWCDDWVVGKELDIEPYQFEEPVDERWNWKIKPQTKTITRKEYNEDMEHFNKRIGDLAERIEEIKNK